MTSLMIADETILLQKADFPDYFIDKQHPDDFRPIRHPIREFIFHRRTDHNRLFLRICFKFSSTSYIPFTFVLDTGAPSQIYINDITRRLIKPRIDIDSETDIEFIKIAGKKMVVKSSPDHHPDTNIIGLMGLCHFGFQFSENEDFTFLNLPDFF